MTFPGSSPKKSWFSNFQAAIAPVLPDDDSPIVRPRGVTVASVLCLLSGLIFLFIGGVWATTGQTTVNTFVVSYRAELHTCTDQVGGYGTAIVPSTAPSTLATRASQCASYLRDFTQSDIDSFKRTQVIYGIVVLLMGLAAGVAGWFIRSGAVWARWMLTGVGLIALLLAGLLQVSNPITLLATLLLVVGLVFCFIGKGSVFFIRTSVARRRH